MTDLTQNSDMHKTINDLNDGLIREIFDYFSDFELFQVGSVCKKWREIASKMLDGVYIFCQLGDIRLFIPKFAPHFSNPILEIEHYSTCNLTMANNTYGFFLSNVLPVIGDCLFQISIEDFRGSAEDLRTIGKSAPNLETFCISTNQSSAELDINPLVENTPKLCHLFIMGFKLKSNIMNALAKCECLLGLSGIADEELEISDYSSLPVSLKYLSIANVKNQDDFIEGIKKLNHLKRLLYYSYDAFHVKYKFGINCNILCKISQNHPELQFLGFSSKSEDILDFSAFKCLKYLRMTGKFPSETLRKMPPNLVTLWLSDTCFDNVDADLSSILPHTIENVYLSENCFKFNVIKSLNSLPNIKKIFLYHYHCSRNYFNNSITTRDLVEITMNPYLEEFHIDLFENFPISTEDMNTFIDMRDRNIVRLQLDGTFDEEKYRLLNFFVANDKSPEELHYLENNRLILFDDHEIMRDGFFPIELLQDNYCGCEILKIESFNWKFKVNFND